MTLPIPDGFSVRPPTMADLEATFDVIVASDMAEHGEADYALDELRTEWKEFDLEQNSWLVFTPEHRLAGFAALSWRNPHHLDAYGYVHPQDAERGVGT